jgi:hypothetical protein
VAGRHVVGSGGSAQFLDNHLAYNARVVINVGNEDHCEPADGDHCSGTPALRRASSVRSIWTRYVGSSLIAFQAAPTRETVRLG